MPILTYLPNCYRAHCRQQQGEAIDDEPEDEPVPEPEEDARAVLGYHEYDRDYVTPIDNDPVSTRYGIELEIDGGDRRTCADELLDRDPSHRLYWLERDGSLTDEGIEIITHPASLRYHLEEFPWPAIADIAQRHGYKSHDAENCGLHVHVSTDAFVDMAHKMKTMGVVHALRSINEQIGRRCSNEYCLQRNYKQQKDRLLCSSGKHDAIVSETETEGNTFEFRFFRGTLKVPTIRASLEYVDCLIRFARTLSVCQIFDGSKPPARTTANLQNLLSEFVRKSNYKNLKSYLKERRITLCVQ